MNKEKFEIFCDCFDKAVSGINRFDSSCEFTHEWNLAILFNIAMVSSGIRPAYFCVDQTKVEKGISTFLRFIQGYEIPNVSKYIRLDEKRDLYEIYLYNNLVSEEELSDLFTKNCSPRSGKDDKKLGEILGFFCPKDIMQSYEQTDIFHRKRSSVEVSTQSLSYYLRYDEESRPIPFYAEMCDETLDRTKALGRKLEFDKYAKELGLGPVYMLIKESKETLELV